MKVAAAAAVATATAVACYVALRASRRSGGCKTNRPVRLRGAATYFLSGVMQGSGSSGSSLAGIQVESQDYRAQMRSAILAAGYELLPPSHTSHCHRPRCGGRESSQQFHQEHRAAPPERERQRLPAGGARGQALPLRGRDGRVVAAQPGAEHLLPVPARPHRAHPAGHGHQSTAVHRRAARCGFEPPGAERKRCGKGALCPPVRGRCRPSACWTVIVYQ